MKISFKETTKKYINHFKLNKVLECINEEESKIYFIGGSTRSIILDKLNNLDIDLVVPEINQKTIDSLANEFEIKINYSYKNLSFKIDNLDIQISSFRKDLINYGRQSKITSTQSIEDDSLRRDLTINSIYINCKGQLTDFYCGRKDLLNSKLKFILDPIKTIQQDYLRAIRYIRFMSLFKNPKTDLSDIEALKFLSKNIKDFVKPNKIKNELSKIYNMEFPNNSLDFIKKNKDLFFLKEYL
ncbi:MAG: hypothetical protein CMI90_03510 [Pelagibacteraceae bacterium]|nr:hypothetical protein [Pelagibacteraceae bacterium]